MANEHNLIPANRQSKSEARANGKKGGIKSGEVRREKARLRDLLSIIPTQDNLPDFAKDMDISCDYKTLVHLSLLNQAAKGSIEAIKYLDDKLGENPWLSLKEREVVVKEKEIEKPQSDNGILDKLAEYLKDEKTTPKKENKE